MSAAMRAFALVVLLAIGCSDDEEALEVFAASSLREVMTEIGRDFEEAHPGRSVRLVFAGSQTLRIQAEAGARFDVFASAHPEHLDRLRSLGRCGPGQVVAWNRLALLVPEASEIQSLADLPRAERIVLGSARVPVGRYADQLLAEAEDRLGPGWSTAVRERVVSRERNARLVRAKLVLGEADAALVYRTDARGPGLRRASMPPDLGPDAEYVVAAGSEAGELFMDWLAGAEARARLEARGFLLP